MTEKDTPTANSILLAPVVQIPYIIALPYFEILRTPFFESSNITNLINQYELMYTNFGVEKKKKIQRLPLYYERFIIKYIKSMI